MNKEELLKMAYDAGCPTWFGVAPMEFVENFANAILERAAVECRNRGHEMCDGALSASDSWAIRDVVKDLECAIRALKGE